MNSYNCSTLITSEKDSDDDEPLDKKIRVIEEKDDIVTVKAEPIPECLENESEESSIAQNVRDETKIENSSSNSSKTESKKPLPPEVPSPTMYKEMSRSFPGAKFVSGSDLAKIQTLQQPDMMYLVIPVPHGMATNGKTVVPSCGEINKQTIPNKQVTPTSSNE